VARALQNDPLHFAERVLTRPICDAIRKEAEEEVRKALEAAAAAPWPRPEEAYEEIQDTGAGRWR
jgi:TPP-dependent pyruvate/acetoin dehydrogenase alpha subunit